MSNRKRLLVDPKVQWAIARRVIGHWTLFLVCLIAISAMVRVMAMAGQQPFADAWRSAFREQIPILGVMFLLLPVFVRDTLKLSNRFAGPMYRLRMALGQMAGGDVPQSIRFRSRDFWQDVAVDFNTVVERYESLAAENEQLKAELSRQKTEV